jgi:hypothetical protein
MKSLFLAALLFAAVASTNAPGDQYFGQMKMSAIRIRFVFMQLKPRYEKHELLPEQAEHLAALAEDSFYAWASAYPKDEWLASTGYLMAGLFEELPGSDAHARAVRALTFVKVHFPNTRYSKESVQDLHRGPPVRPDPAWAVAMRASPSPSASPTSSASASPAPAASPVPSPSAS